MTSGDLTELLHHVIKLVPFPHEWNDFQLMAFQGDHALFRKLTNEQYFAVPLAKITAKRPVKPGDRAELTHECEVHWKRDDTGYGHIWVADPA
jgi:hypothetical protein